MRLRCVLFGCWCDENHACPKCGAAVYDADYIQIGKLDWIGSIRGWLLNRWAFVTQRCDVCRKRVWFSDRRPCCSEECFDKWIPF